MPLGQAGAGYSICWALLLALLVGCGASSSRLPVNGSVMGPNGEAITGSISFTPTKDNSGAGATASLVEGKYRFDRSNGPEPGGYEVIITRTSNKMEVVQRNAQANTKMRWSFPTEVPANGPYEIDFKLD